MADFSIDDYFANRRQEEANEGGTNAVRDKYLELQRTSENKVRQLAEMSSIAAQKRQIAEEANRGSLVNKLGLNVNDIDGTIVNTGARVLAGASRNVIGNLVALPADISASLQTSYLDEADHSAYGRHRQGVATAEDMARLNLVPREGNPDGNTKLTSFLNADQRRENAKSIRDLFNIDYITNKDKTVALTDQLGEGFQSNWDQTKAGWVKLTGEKDASGLNDIASGIASLIYNAGEAGAQNPGGTAEYIAENLPQLLVGMGGKAGTALLGATNISYAYEKYDEGFAKYQKENGGALPPEEVRRDIAMWAASLALAEQVGELTVLGKMLPTKVAAETVRDSFKKSLLKSASGTGQAVFSEAATEGYQTFAEGKVVGEEASEKDIYTSAAIGGLVGGGTTGGLRAPTDVANSIKAATEAIQSRKDPVDPASAEVLAAAINSGDVSSMTDTTKKTYAPDKAIRALFGNSQLPTTTDEAKQANLTKADEILTGLESAIDENKQLLITPEDRQKKIDRMQTSMAALDPADTASKARYERYIASEQEALAEPPLAAEELAGLTARASKLNRALVDAKAAREELNQLVNAKEDSAALVEQANAPDQDPVTAKAAVGRILTLAMSGTGKLTAEQATKLADNTNNGFSEVQREFLRKFSEARVAENMLMKLEDVTSDIYLGVKNKGIAEYQQKFLRAANSGNESVAIKELGGLIQFAKDHHNKSLAIKEAMKAGPGAKVVSTGNQNWVVTKQDMTTKELRDVGGLEKITPNLAHTIAMESAALNAAASEMLVAYALKFKTGAANVTNVSQPKSGSESKPQATQASPTEKAGPVGNAVESGTVPDKDAAAAVETVGVTEQAKSVKSFLDRISEAYTPEDMTTIERDIASEKLSDTDRDQLKTAIEKQMKENDRSSESNTTQEPIGSTVEVKAVQPTTVENKDAEVKSKENTTDEVAESDEKVASEVESGALEAFTQYSPEGATFEERLFAADHFKQDLSNKDKVASNPLLAVKDFVTKVHEDQVAVTNFLNDKILSKDQSAAMQEFFEHVGEWFPHIDANVPVVSERIKYKDVMQLLINVDPEGKGYLDENLKTAIVYGAYSWLMEAAASPQYLRAKGVNGLLGRAKDKRVSYRANQTLAHVGSYQHRIADSIGGRIIDVLAIKELPDNPQNELAKLRMALGMHAIKVLEDSGRIKRTQIQESVMQELREEGLNSNETNRLYKSQEGDLINQRAVHTFFAVVRNKDGTLIDVIENALQLNKAGGSVIDNLFNYEDALSIPSLEPITDVQSTTAGTDQGVPSELREVLLKKQSEKYVVRKDLMGLLGLFENTEDVLTMMGVEEVSDETTHLVNRRSVQAKNDGLRREYDQFVDFVGEHLATSEKGLDTPFYLRFSAWVQQRVGIATRAVNPQSSKIHRQLVVSPDWVTTVDSTDREMMDSFFLRVGEGLGVKTESTDNYTALIDIHGILSEPEFTEAIEVLRKGVAQQQPLSKEEQAIVVAAVSKGGQNLYSLSALVAMAYQVEAKEAANGGAYTFTSQLMGEADGVANGTMFNHVLLGAAEKPSDLQTVADRGGFYAVGNEHTSYNTWHGDMNNMDIYQYVARKLFIELNSIVYSNHSDTLKSIWAIAGDIYNDEYGVATSAGRNLIKGAMNPLAFGSSMKSVVTGMSEAFLGTVYAGFEKLAKDPNTKQTHVDAYVTRVNTLIDQEKLRLPVGKPLSYHMNNVIPRAAEASIMNAYQQTVGLATRELLEVEFADFLNRRNALNTGAQQAYGIYAAVYNGMREDYIEELVKEGTLPLTVRGLRAGDLSKEQEKEFVRLMSAVKPEVQTVMSKKDKKGSGLLVAKRKRKVNRDPLYNNETKFGSPLRNGDKSANLQGFLTTLENIGVTIGSGLTHSLDSAIAHRTQAKRNVLNVHDSVGDGVAGLKASAALMNQNTWTALLTYSPLREMYNTLADTVAGVANMIEEGSLSPQAEANLKKFMITEADKRGVKPDKVIDLMLTELKLQADHADRVKLGMMADWQSVNQYAYEGGEYTVTDRDRAAAEAMLEALDSGVLAEHIKAAEAVGKLFFSTKKAIATPVLEVVQEVHAADYEVTDDPAQEIPPQDTTDTDISKETVWGPIGTPRMASDNRLVAAFKDKPVMTGKEALREAFRMVGSHVTPEMKLFYKELLPRMAALMPEDLTVTYVTPDTLPEVTEPVEGQKTTMVGVRGWYTNSEKGHIYVMSPDFVNSGLTPELLIHELLHGILVGVMENPVKGTPAYVLTKDLEALREKASAFVAAMPESTDKDIYQSAVANIHELVAYGMSSTNFQNAVLNKIMVEETPGKGKGRLLAGTKHFIKSLIDYFFSGRNKANEPGMITGMESLITNTSLLFDAVQRDQNKNATGKSFAMAGHPSPGVELYNTMDIFNSIGNGGLGLGFKTHLQGLLNGIVNKIHGPFGSFKESMRKTEAGNPMAVWLKALDTGKAPFASKILASGFTGNAQQDFVIEQVEATVRAALDGNDAYTKEAYRELAGLYAETYKRLKPADFLGGEWHTNTQAEAQAMYDFVFKLDKANGDRSDYLARFAALGLAHEGFNKLLQAPTKFKTPTVVKSFAERLQKFFEGVLEFFSRRVTNTFEGMRADSKLTVLVDKLVDIEAKKRHALQRQAAGDVPFTETMEEGLKKFTEGAVNKASDFLNKPSVRNSGNAFVRAGSGLARTMVGGRVDQFMEAMTMFRDSQFKGQLGIVAGLLNNVKGPNDVMKGLLLISKGNEKTRKQQITYKSKFVLSSFDNEGRDLKKADKRAITATFLRTGAHHLLGHMDTQKIHQLLTDSSALDAEIASFEGQLGKFGSLANEFIEDANGLGYYTATGVSRVLSLKMNAHAIAKRFGGVSQLSDAQVDTAVAVISPLVALYALRYTSSDLRSKAADILSTENARPADQGNGVQFVLELQKKLEEESLHRLFKGNPALMVHGYTPEIYNPHTLITTATEAEGKKLEDLGYSKGAQVAQDPADPDQDVKHIYRLSDGGLSPHLTGVVGFDGMRAKGSSVHSGYLDINTMTGANNASTNASVMAHRARLKAGAAGVQPNRDLSIERGSYMAPLFNESGDLVNWRYLMTAHTKDILLERENGFDKLIGSLAGTIQGKETTVEQNKVAVQAMHDQYTSEYATRGDSYVLVGAKSTDHELRAIWNMLPEATKQDVKDIWGREGMMVRSDSVDLIFGYRKVSAADPIKRANAERDFRRSTGGDTSLLSLNSINLIQKAAIGVIEEILKMHGLTKGMSSVDAENYAKRAAHLVSKGERIWQEVVSETKDILVVKTGTTLLWNIFSNYSMLYLQGLSIKEMVDHTLVAFKGATTHRADTEELDKLRTQLATGYTQGRDNEIKRRILILEDAIARNPVHDLIEAGLMPTIVEDLAADEDVYSYKSALSRKVDGFASKLNPTVVGAARTVYMAHDTKLYKGLSHITQLSDFVARYALYQHQTTRKVNPLSKKEAVLRASDAFVNYDIPMHRGMQYSDDMGFTMFTKYFLYIQKELLRVAREHPGRVYSTILLNNYMNLGPIVLESSMFTHAGNNPIRNGAFSYLGSIDELMTVSGALAIVK